MEVFTGLFGDAVGLTSLVVVVLTLAIPIAIWAIYVIKSGDKEQ